MWSGNAIAAENMARLLRTHTRPQGAPGRTDARSSYLVRAVSFGLVTIPVKLEPATESHNIAFNQIHLEDGGRIRYRKVCELDGKVLTQDEIGKGYEVSKDHVIPITDTDLAQMPLPTAKAIEIVAFVDRKVRGFVDSRRWSGSNRIVCVTPVWRNVWVPAWPSPWVEGLPSRRGWWSWRRPNERGPSHRADGGDATSRTHPPSHPPSVGSRGMQDAICPHSCLT